MKDDDFWLYTCHLWDIWIIEQYMSFQNGLSQKWQICYFDISSSVNGKKSWIWVFIDVIYQLYFCALPFKLCWFNWTMSLTGYMRIMLRICTIKHEDEMLDWFMIIDILQFLQDGDELTGLHCFRHLRDHVAGSVESVNRWILHNVFAYPIDYVSVGTKENG